MYIPVILITIGLILIIFSVYRLRDDTDTSPILLVLGLLFSGIAVFSAYTFTAKNTEKEVKDKCLNILLSTKKISLNVNNDLEFNYTLNDTTLSELFTELQTQRNF